MSFNNAYTMGAQQFVGIDTVTSEATDHDIEFAFDHNLDSYWKPTSTANQNIELDLKFPADIINGQGDRDFSSAANWANVDFNSFDKTTDLSVTATVADQECKLAAAGLNTVFVPGKTYEIRYDCANLVATLVWRTGAELIGTVVTGTEKTLQFTATAHSDELVLRSTTTSGSADIDNVSIIEVDERYEVDSFALYINNPDEIHGPDANPTLTISFSEDGAVYKTWTTITFATMESTNLFGRLILVTGLTSQMRRYWKFALSSMATTLEVNQFLLLKATALTRQNVYPEKTARTFSNDLQRLPGGRRSVNIGTSIPFRTFRRTFKIFLPSVLTALQSIYDLSAGTALPLIIYDDSVYYFVRNVNPIFDPILIEFEVWTVTMIFEEIRYIPLGGAY